MFFEGIQFPVCYRCMGLFTAMAVSYIFIKIMKSTVSLSKYQSYWLAVFMLPLCMDGVGISLGLWDSVGYIRTVTGVLVGISISLFLTFIRSNKKTNPIITSTFFSLTFLPFMVSLGILLPYYWIPSWLLFNFYALLSVSGLLVFVIQFLKTFRFLRMKISVT